MQLEFRATSAEIFAEDYKYIGVRVETSNISEILKDIDISNIIDYYGEDDLLSEIGITKAKDFFDLIDKNEDL